VDITFLKSGTTVNEAFGADGVNNYTDILASVDKLLNES